MKVKKSRVRRLRRQVLASLQASDKKAARQDAEATCSHISLRRMNQGVKGAL